MSKLFTTDASLTAIANAIRTKSGASGNLTYPDEFVSAIQSISASGINVSDTTAIEADVRSGKYFHKSNGAKVQGSLPNGSAATPATTITSNPAISLTVGGLITASNNKTQDITPTVSAGYVSSGTAGTITVDGSTTEQLPAQAAQTIYPSTADQVIDSGKWLAGVQTIKGVAISNILASNIKQGVTVKVGDANNAERIVNVTGTYKSTPKFTYTERTSLQNISFSVSGQNYTEQEETINNFPSGEILTDVKLYYDNILYNDVDIYIKNPSNGKIILSYNAGGSAVTYNFNKIVYTTVKPDINV